MEKSVNEIEFSKNEMKPRKPLYQGKNDKIDYAKLGEIYYLAN